MQPADQITDLLASWRGGESAAEEQLLEILYPHLRAIAAKRLQAAADLTLGTTELVHEAYLRLLDQDRRWHNRFHFFAIAARVMRRVVIDFARRRGRQKRGAGLANVRIEEVEGVMQTPDTDWLDLDRALDELAAIDRRAAQVVELRFFAGLSVEDVAAGLSLSPATVQRDWRFARAWLRQRLAAAPGSVSRES